MPNHSEPQFIVRDVWDCPSCGRRLPRQAFRRTGGAFEHGTQPRAGWCGGPALSKWCVDCRTVEPVAVTERDERYPAEPFRRWLRRYVEGYETIRVFGAATRTPERRIRAILAGAEVDVAPEFVDRATTVVGDERLDDLYPLEEVRELVPA